MKKFITKFLLITSIFLLGLQAKNTDLPKVDEVLTEANQTEANKTEEVKQSSVLSGIIKQSTEQISEENKTAEKERLVEFLTDGKEANKSDNEIAVAELIAEKAVNSPKKPDDSNKQSLGDIVKEIKDINIKIDLLKASDDSNKTADEVSSLQSTKESLLLHIPSAITNQTVDEAALIAYLTNKKDLNKKLSKLQNRKNSFDYFDANLSLTAIEIGESFYSSLLRLEYMFKDGRKESEIKKLIQDTLLNLQIKDFSNIKNKISELNIKDDQNATLNKKYSNLISNKKTYEEILSYLSKNTNLLTGNALFVGLNLKFIIDYINDLSPFEASAINLGKIIPIILIMVLLFSIRRFLANIIYFVFTLFNKNKEKNIEIKTQVVDLIKKPLGVLLIAYGVDICLSIFYYPSPVPLIFNKAFGVIFILLYSWLIIEIINGYGIIIISKLAKKSSRKEVLNLVVKILYIVVIIVAFLLILTKMGINVSAIVASLGIGGLAVALATKDIIANLFASIMVLFDNSFSQGDWIVVGNVEGTVVETGLRKTTIRTFDNSLVFVPNSKIIDNNIVNWSRRKVGRQIKMFLGLNYSTPPHMVEQVIKEIKEMLYTHPGIANPTKKDALNDMRFKYRQSIVSLDDLAGYKNNLFVTLDKFDDSSINIMIYCFTKSVVWAEFLDVKQDVMIKMMKILEKNKVGFAFPSKSVYIEETPMLKDIISVKDNGDKATETKQIDVDDKNDKNINKK